VEDEMKYLLLICAKETYAAERNPPDVGEVTQHWVDEMTTRGVRTLGLPLRPASTATTVRVRDDEVLLSDGPFAETTEQILGFDLLECADLDEAIEVAAKHPAARIGTIEVRPVWPT
jgi:hypothetical protein